MTLPPMPTSSSRTSSGSTSTSSPRRWGTQPSALRTRCAPTSTSGRSSDVATFYVDRDGRGGTKGNDSLTTWSVAARVGDPTKPFASVQAAADSVTAANSGGNDTIRVRKEITSTPYAAPTNSGQQPVAK